MATIQRITPFLWFANEAEEAACFYTSVFKNSRITAISRYSDAGTDVHGRPAGSVMVVAFELDGMKFNALNGGPAFKFNESVSFQIDCENQQEIDYYWEKLGAGGDPKAQQCGWLKDRYGLSWQVTPKMEQFFGRDQNSPGAKRAMEAMLKMKKIDIAALERAYRGAEEKAKV
jgi:predicted 3-demethylubiquinone-9 3-methyltransferase (glyoxalase superfamily)